MIPIITVSHKIEYTESAEELGRQINLHANDAQLFVYDHTNPNVGFAKACNVMARKIRAIYSYDYMGFINPDAEVLGNFSNTVNDIFGLYPDVMVTGNRYGKPDSHLREWGVKNWVCGAAFFVRAPHFYALDGFDENFVWAFEETDFIRRTEVMGLRAMSVDLPIAHSSPTSDRPEDIAYKEKYFSRSQQYYSRKWNG